MCPWPRLAVEAACQLTMELCLQSKRVITSIKTDAAVRRMLISVMDVNYVSLTTMWEVSDWVGFLAVRAGPTNPRRFFNEVTNDGNKASLQIYILSWLAVTSRCTRTILGSGKFRNTFRQLTIRCNI